MSTHFQGLGYICLLKIHILKNQFFDGNSLHIPISLTKFWKTKKGAAFPLTQKERRPVLSALSSHFFKLRN